MAEERRCVGTEAEVESETGERVAEGVEVGAFDLSRDVELGARTVDTHEGSAFDGPRTDGIVRAGVVGLGSPQEVKNGLAQRDRPRAGLRAAEPDSAGLQVDFSPTQALELGLARGRVECAVEPADALYLGWPRPSWGTVWGTMGVLLTLLA